MDIFRKMEKSMLSPILAPQSHGLMLVRMGITALWSAKPVEVVHGAVMLGKTELPDCIKT